MRVIEVSHKGTPNAGRCDHLAMSREQINSMLPPTKHYDELFRNFRWQIPPRFNIGVDVCDRWVAIDARRLAIVFVQSDGRAHDITYGWLRETSNQLANALRAHGIGRGD